MTLDGSTGRSRTGRRELLGALGAAALGGAFADTAGAADGQDCVLRQGDRCVPVTPLRGDRPVQDLYGYREAETRYSASGMEHLQRADGSILFLYDGPNGRSLVAVHGALDGDGDGGSASFAVEGLPASGEWVVRDDSYDGASNYDRWDLDGTTASADWTWAGGRTDGGAFRGLGEQFSVTVTPAFGEDAALADRYYDGRVDTWELLTGDLADPDRVALRRDEPVTLATGTCDDGGGGDDGPDDPDDPDDGDDATRAEQFERKAERFEEKAERVRERFEEKAERFEEKAEERDGEQAEKFRRKAEEMRRKGERKARNFERKAERARQKAEQARTGAGRDGSSTRGDHGAGDDDDDREDDDDDDDPDDDDDREDDDDDDDPDDDDDEEREDDDDDDDGGDGEGRGRGRGDDGEDRDEDEDEGDDDDD